MFPVYYNPAALTAAEIATAKKAWDIIELDRSVVYLEKLHSTTFQKAFPNSKDWFCDIFYERLFDVHPVSVHI